MGSPGCCGRAKNRKPPRLRDPFLQKLDPLADQVERQVAHAGHGPARTGEALDQLAVHRIATESEHHGRWRLHRSHGIGHEFLRNDDVGLHFKKLARHRLHVVAPGCPEKMEDQVLALHPAELP